MVFSAPAVISGHIIGAHDSQESVWLLGIWQILGSDFAHTNLNFFSLLFLFLLILEGRVGWISKRMWGRPSAEEHQTGTLETRRKAFGAGLSRRVLIRYSDDVKCRFLFQRSPPASQVCRDLQTEERLSLRPGSSRFIRPYQHHLYPFTQTKVKLLR